MMNFDSSFSVPTLLLGIALSVSAKSGCTINPIADDQSPCVIPVGGNEFIYPDLGEKSLTFASKQSVDFACPGSSVNVGSDIKASVVKATCVDGKTFEIDGKNVKWSEVLCSARPAYTGKYNGNRCANNKGKEMEVGFEINEDRFITVYILCYDTKTQESLYSYHNVTLDINEETSANRPSWKQINEFCTIKANTYYTKNTQRQTINDLLGLSKDSNKYVQDHTNYYLARGHMTAKADGFYSLEQNATFLMMNVAPQWQTFNEGNWKEVEYSVRKYAGDKDVNVQVYTGVYGVTTLPHASTGKETELWLYVDENGNKALPVPEIYWKVVYDEKNSKGVVLIGINNPYKEEYKALCSDVSKSLNWLNWDKDNQQKGFSYACNVDEFRKVVDFVPKLDIDGLLE